MKKRNPLKQYKTTKGSDFVPLEEIGEVSFWLVKIDPVLMAKVDALRIELGNSKKGTVTRMAKAYLSAMGRFP